VKLLRRKFLYLAAGAAALPEVSRLAWAQTYPSRPVHCMVGFPAGGPNDIVGRLIVLEARLSDLGAVPMPMAPAAFGKFIADETEKWAKVIKFANIKAE